MAEHQEDGEGASSKRIRMGGAGDDSTPAAPAVVVVRKKIKKKIYPSIAQYPSVDFKALLEHDRERIERDCNVVISMRGKGSGFPGDDEGKDPLHVLIEADSEDQGHKAERMVRDCITDPAKLPPPVQTQVVVRQSIFGPRAPRPEGGGSGRPFGGAGGGMESYKEVRVADDTAGAIIGRGGETVKRMQMETGTRIAINRDGPVHADGTRTIVIRGPTQESVDHCERLVLDFVAAKERSRAAPSVVASAGPTSYGAGQQPGRSSSTSPPPPASAYGQPYSITDYYTIPNNRAGAVIGRGGATVKAIQSKYRARVNVPGVADAANPTMRTITIIADSQQQIDSIRREIDAIVEGRPNSFVGSTEELGTPVRIPDDKAGLIIGKQGSTIKSIQDRLGVRIQIPPHAEEGSVPPMRVALITGRPDMVAIAIQEIDAIVSGQVYTGQVVAAAKEAGYMPAAPDTTPYERQQASADYTKQWEEYYNQLRQLPPEQQKIALEALAEHQKQMGAYPGH